MTNLVLLSLVNFRRRVIITLIIGNEGLEAFQEIFIPLKNVLSHLSPDLRDPSFVGIIGRIATIDIRKHFEEASVTLRVICKTLLHIF